MRASLWEGTLVIDDILEVQSDGRYVLRAKVGGAVENLAEALIQFAGKILARDIILPSSWYCVYENCLALEGKKVLFIVPTKIKFDLGKVLGYADAREKTAKLKVGRVVFYEKRDDIENLLLNLAVRSRIGLPGFLLRADVDREANLTFYDPKGNIAFIIGLQGYVLNYRYLKGYFKDSAVIKRWFENVLGWILKNKEAVKITKESYADYKIWVGNFWFRYNLVSDEILGWEYKSKDFTITTVEHGFGVWFRGSDLVLYIATEEEYNEMLKLADKKLEPLKKIFDSIEDED